MRTNSGRADDMTHFTLPLLKVYANHNNNAYTEMSDIHGSHIPDRYVT